MNIRHRSPSLGLRIITWIALLAFFVLPTGASSQAILSVISEIQRFAPDGVPHEGYFGQNMVVNGNTMLVSSENTSVEGKVYLFTRDWLGLWHETAVLQVSGPSINAVYHYSLAVTEDTAFIGEPYKPVDNVSSGVIHVFKRQAGNVWKNAGTIKPSDPVPFGRFGTSLATDGKTLVIGASYTYDLGAKTPGVAYVFSKDATGVWKQVGKLFSQDRYNAREFGAEVAISGDEILIADPALYNQWC